MASIFVSHSSEDDAAAIGLEAWLRRHGFTDLFIDHSNIVGGEKWARALREAAAACRVIVCLVTEHWLASDECFGEFKAGWYMGKRIIPLLAVGACRDSLRDRLANVLAEDQGFDVTRCMREGHLDLAIDPQVERRLGEGLRAAGALADIGLDPEAFAADPKLRPTPFPGLVSFSDDDADAALFYGRSREIAEVLEELRKIRAEGDRRPLVILGASGAGKSSLLKAGIIPRLRREAPAWLPLRAFRPGADPLLNFADALARTLADFGKIEAHGVVRDRLLEAWRNAERNGNDPTPAGRAAIENALEIEGARLRAAAGRGGATILVGIDQAEEMARAEGDSGEALADYLRAALASAASRWQLAFTIRIDNFPELQGHRRFRDLKARGYDLRALPAFRFASVVEEPAKRYGVTIDHALADALMDGAPKEDALPLLAFALQRLWGQYAASGSLTKDHYDKVGGLRGLIEDAAERALWFIAPEQDVPLPSGPPPKYRVELAASTFVPALVQLNDQSAAIRRVAPWISFNSDQQELLRWFERWRLLVRRAGDAEGGTIEVAHEALFREWARLKGWLEPERARLEALRSLQVDALTWDRNGRDPAFLNHRGKRLEEAMTLAGIERYRKRMSAVEFEHLAACRSAEQLALEAERAAFRRKRRLELALFCVLFLLSSAGVAYALWTNYDYLRAQAEAWGDDVWPRRLTADIERDYAQMTLAPGRIVSFRECSRCPEMIVVPAGQFLMGSAPGEARGSDNEAPRHDVTIASNFAVSKFEVTFDDWKACADARACDDTWDQGWGRGRRPLINVSWHQARQFVDWLSHRIGEPGRYRLLSEAEWEYAALAGARTAYSWGNDVGKDNANCYGCGSQWDYRQSAPAGSFAANAFGLYDMHGNVFEWVEDCYHPNYLGAPDDGSAWTTSCEQDYRVRRGGSWYVEPANVRAAFRDKSVPGDRDNDLGFRVARTLKR